MGITEKAYKYRESNPAESRRILEEGLKKYPENDIFIKQSAICNGLFSKAGWKQLQLPTSLLKKPPIGDVKYDALRFLAYAYKAKGT